MRIAFIGAGKAGCSLAGYFRDCGEEVAGFYSPNTRAAGFNMYDSAEKAAEESDLLIISVNDDSISAVWQGLDRAALRGKTVCHLSGSLTSEVFGAHEGVNVCSLHPVLAFSSRETEFKYIKSAFFTLEGDDEAIKLISELVERCGNRYKVIKAESKAAYHAAACFVSNFMTAVCAEGFDILREECGFTDREALMAMSPLIEVNAANICKKGIKPSLTGPVSRGDSGTVTKHLKALAGRKRDIYKLLSSVLAEESGHTELLPLFEEE